MHRVRSFGRTTFSSLSVPNFRLYAIGQGISQTGTWMQTVGQGLLVLKLTGNGTALGLVVALQTLPMLLLGPWGGVIADRFPKRTTLLVTQAISCVLALTMGTLVATDAIRLWMVYGLALVLGFVSTVDQPTRQTFVVEMVGRDNLANAVSLISTEVNLARVIGPSIAGGLVATVGLSACFIVDGLSYIAVIASLLMMRPEQLFTTDRLARGRGQLQEALRYVKTAPPVLSTLVMMAIVGMLTYEFSIVLPIFAEFTFHAGASGYAAMTAMMGLGAVAGGLVSASRRSSGTRAVRIAALFFGLAVLGVAIAPAMWIALAGLLVVGFCSITYTSIGNVTVQMNTASEMRGRVMALWSVAFLGTTPIGGPLMGWIGEDVGARWALTVGGSAAIVAAGIGWLLVNRMKPAAATADAPAVAAGTPAGARPSLAQAGITPQAR